MVLLKFVDVAVDISIIGGEKLAGSVLSVRSFEGTIAGNLEVVVPVDGDPMVVL